MTAISFLYKGSTLDGTIFDDSGNEPHEIVTGRSQVMPLVEKNLIEMEVGEERTINLPSEDAYGAYLEKNVERVPLYTIPHGEDLREGAVIHWTSPRNNKPIPVTIRSIVDQIVEMDFNHPLAGKDLVYWVKVTSKKD